MKSKLFKSMVLASTLVFMNCGEDNSTSPLNNLSDISSSSGEIVQSGENGNSSGSVAGTEVNPTSESSVQGGGISQAVESSGSTATEVTSSAATEVASSSGTAEVPASSADVAPASSADAVPTSSSEEARPASSSETAPVVCSSSSEQKVESSSSEAPKLSGIFLAEGKEEEKDQMQVEYIEHTGFDGGGILAYPKQLSSDKKHAVVVWGPGGGTEPGAYGGMIHRLASHGFVVIALRESPGNASQGKPALDWLEKKNKDPNDPLYNKLDMTKVGCSGHSMGGLESEQMVIQDSRVITAMLNNSGDLGHTAMTRVPTNKTIGIVYGNNGMERPNAEADYNNGGVKAPACLIMMEGADWGHGSGPWGGMAATVAWMRWHLGGEDFRKADFVGSSGKYIHDRIIGGDGNWNGKCKNF